MADTDIPDRINPAMRIALWVGLPFIFLLVTVERALDEHYYQALICLSLFFLSVLIAVRWNEIGIFLRSQKLTLLLLGLGAISLLGLGIAIGGLFRSSLFVAPPQATGRISWNFDQIAVGQANFLNLGRLNQDEIRVVGFGVHGKNTSKDPITELRGYVRSDLTNDRLPIFILAEDPNASPSPFHPAQIPTRPEETFGIPGLADFDIVTYEQAIIQTGVDGVPVSKFLREYGSATLVLEYDGIKLEHQFSTEQIKKAIENFEATSNPQRTTAPRVTRKSDATPPIPNMLPFPAPQIVSPNKPPG